MIGWVWRREDWGEGWDGGGLGWGGVGWGRQSGGVAGAVGRWVRWWWVGGVIRRCRSWPRSTAGYRLASLWDAGVGAGVVRRCRSWPRSTAGRLRAGIPMGCACVCVRYPAVSLVASLNRRLQAGIPMGCGCGGGRCPAVSLVASLNRRLRAGIPMGCWEGRKCGVVACGVVGAWKVDGFDACIVALSFGLCDEGSGAGVESGVARAIA